MLLNSKLLQSCLLITSLSISLPSGAALFTQGDLTYDDTTQIISGNGKEYLGFGVGASWDYATTVANTSSGGLYESFTIANTSVADEFIGSIFGSSSEACSVVDATPTNYICGTLTGWSDAKFGGTFNIYYDYFWFIADESASAAVGFVEFTNTGSVQQYEDWSTILNSDRYSSNGNASNVPVTWLLVRDATTGSAVPEPSVIALMGLGIFGLGLARRKIKK